MTRETKIGLLVGLAFIIVIGILLSDQLMRSTEPPPAPLAGAADTVRKATLTPASNQPGIVTRAATVTPAEVLPENTVPVREEVVARPPPVTFVEIRPGNGGTAIVVPGQAPQPEGRGSAGQVNAIPSGVGNEIASRPQTNNDVSRARTLADAAAAVGETLVGLDGQPIRGTAGQNVLAGQNVRTPPAAGVAMKQYKAENGDNLSKLAIKFFGSNSKAARDAILAANPSLAANPNQILIGQTYNIPIIEGGAAPTGNRGSNVVSPVRNPAPAENWYTVKSGDSLLKIAIEQCGDKNMAAAIKELNRDNVKDWNRLAVDAKIRLPVKAAGASARLDR